MEPQRTQGGKASMSCYCVHTSPWIRGKALDFLENLLVGWKEKIEDSDVFELLMVPGSQEFLAAEVEKHLPKSVIRKMSMAGRANQLELDVDELPVSMGILWDNEALRKQLRKIVPALVAFARERPPESLAAPDEDRFPARLAEIKRLLKFSDLECELLVALLILNECLICHPLNRRCRSSFARKLQMCSHFLKISEADLIKLLSDILCLILKEIFVLVTCLWCTSSMCPGPEGLG